MVRFFFGIFLVLFGTSPLYAQWKSQVLNMVQNGTVLAVAENGTPLFAHNIDQRFVPASTLKVGTALTALYTLGKDYRFKTEFYSNGSDGVLYIKGYGDPFMVSEEISRLAFQLKEKGIKKVAGIVLDASFYDESIQVSGRSNTLNPYDAQLGALVANFNTIMIQKDNGGKVTSAELQTPTTELHTLLASKARVGKSRISLVHHPREAVLYFGYLLKEFLIQNNIPVTGVIQKGLIPKGSKVFYTYYNSRNLQQVLTPALEYSQNLVMNQVFLASGAKLFGAPATMEKGRQAMDTFFRKQLGMTKFSLEEGSGLSRQNLFSATEMDKIMVKFFPYKDLLPLKHNMRVKTGTLNGVACLVGYFKSTQYGWVRFVIMLNQGANYRFEIAKLLKENLQ